VIAIRVPEEGDQWSCGIRSGSERSDAGEVDFRRSDRNRQAWR
jgi:hypothetical protein